MADKIYVDTNCILLAIPEASLTYIHWQRGFGQHVSQPRKSFGSVNITLMDDSDCPVTLIHFVLDSSSLWVIGRNETRTAYI